MVFIKVMKDKTKQKFKENGLHKGDEWDKTKQKSKENGLHKGDEGQNKAKIQRKWSS